LRLCCGLEADILSVDIGRIGLGRNGFCAMVKDKFQADGGFARIRMAQESDAEVLLDLSNRTVLASYSSFLGKDAVEGYIQSGAIERFIKGSLGRCWVIVGDGGLLGYSVTREHMIDLMMIDCLHHRKGLGSQLLEHTEQWLFEQFDELILESFAANEQANAFYRAKEWMRRDEVRDDVSGAMKIVFGKDKSSH